MASNSPISGIASLTVSSNASICAWECSPVGALKQDVVAGLRIKGRIEINQVDALVAHTNWVRPRVASLKRGGAVASGRPFPPGEDSGY
jgi:hypothetical protein